MDWTEETILRLRSLWQEGLSTAEIGRRLSITKNAVVGKAHRLTLPPRPSPIRKSAEGALLSSSKQKSDAAAVTRLIPKAAAPAPEAPPLVATVTKLHATPLPQPAEADASRFSVAPVPRRRGQTCCWPLGEPGTKQFHFCGGDPLPGKPYCCEHAQLAYVKLRDRRDTVA